MTDLKQWRKDGRHLPAFMRDFHDQKDLFKTIHEQYRLDETKDHRNSPSWVDAQIYTIDSFLWFMAAHGWTLQRNRKKSQAFHSIHSTLEAAKRARDAIHTAMLKEWLSQGKER